MGHRGSPTLIYTHFDKNQEKSLSTTFGKITLPLHLCTHDVSSVYQCT